MNVRKQNFLDEVSVEVNRARSKFPDTEDMALALVEEVGELCQALIQQKHEPQRCVRHEDIWKEALQVACMATRMATEGCVGFPYDPESGYRGPNWSGYKSCEDEQS